MPVNITMLEIKVRIFKFLLSYLSNNPLRVNTTIIQFMKSNYFLKQAY